MQKFKHGPVLFVVDVQGKHLPDMSFGNWDVARHNLYAKSVATLINISYCSANFRNALLSHGSLSS